VTQAEMETPASRWKKVDEQYFRLSDCLECGMCVSACPIALTTASYLGPGVLSGAHAHGLKGSPMVLNQVDSEDGVWRCHSAFECTAVCPSFVDPGRRIMALRTEVVSQKIKRLFGGL
jgi:succinate dehydrogenase / fumarate reductase iron-sulfur subunit